MQAYSVPTNTCMRNRMRNWGQYFRLGVGVNIALKDNIVVDLREKQMEK